MQESLGQAGKREQRPLVRSRSLLVVDDDEQVAKLYKIILTSAGYSVCLARNGAECLEKYGQALAEDPYALVMLDMSMPGMNGGECLRRLRGMDPQVRVLISSGSSEEDLAGLAGQVAGVVPKPSTMATLIEKVHDVLAAPAPGPAL